jgi:hypothetical protein
MPNPEPSAGDDEVIYSKHPTRGQGVQGWIAASYSLFIMDSAGIQTSGNNQSLLERDRFNHVAFVHDRENNRQTIIVNARHAGSAFTTLPTVAANTSGFALGGRGSPDLDPIAGGAGFSGVLDDWMIFDRALTLPEVSGLAANSYSYVESSGQVTYSPVGAYVSGLPVGFISGFFGSWLHGQAQDIELVGGYVTSVSGVQGAHGGWVHGRAFVSGFTGGFVHGLGQISGTFGTFVHGMGIVSGIIGSYVYGGRQTDGEFDIAFTFQIVSADDFDARLGVELTKFRDFDARLGVLRITSPPTCALTLPLAETVVSGLPYSLTVQGSGISSDNKTIDQIRFTFADFKQAASGTLIGGVKDRGLYEATRVIDTQGLYTVKIEVIDSFGYRSTCSQQVLIIGSGDALPTSGEVLDAFPGVALSTSIVSGVAKEVVSFTHSLSGLSDTSGIFEYTDFSDGQESLVNSLEMPTGTISNRAVVSGVRQHEYSMPGNYVPVWSVSGSWGIVSDTVVSGFDFQSF